MNKTRLGLKKVICTFINQNLCKNASVEIVSKRKN